MTKTSPDAALKNVRGTRIFYLAALLAAAAAVWQTVARTIYPLQTFDLYAERGEAIFHAVLDKGASYSMPLFSLLTAWTGYHGLGGIDLMVKAALLGVYLLAYSLGAAGGRRARGLFFVLPLLAMDLTGAGMEAEQIVYTFLLLLYLNLEDLRLAKPGPAASAVSGLALGTTLLVRSPLFIFAPIAALCELAAGGPLKKRLLRAALFLAAAYILLIPWIGVNKKLFGQFIPFEQERSSCNIITAVKGSVFTMEGDCRALAGLSRTASVPAWALKEAAAHPLVYVSGVFKRLWQVFLLFPVLLPLALMGLAAAWKKENMMPASLAGYFILIHCLLSIEERYFYPLRYLLALVAAAGAFELFSKRKEPGGARGSGVPLYALFTALMVLTLTVEYRLLVYPARAENPLIAVDRELRRYPSDPWLLKEKGTLLLGFDRTKEGMDLLARSFEASGGKELALGYITRTVNGVKAPDWPSSPDSVYELNLVKLLKELELGRMDAAASTLDRTKGYWAVEKNRLKGVPYEKDKAVLDEIQRSTFTWADYDLYRAMYYWPVEKRADIIDRLGRLTPITLKLEFLREESRAANSPGRYPSPEPGTGSWNAWSPGSDLDYNATALALTKAVLAKTGPISMEGLPQPLPLVLTAAEPLISKGDIAALAANLGRNADYRELGAIVDLYENPPDSAAFLAASRRLLTLRPGELAPLIIRLAALRGKNGADALADLEKDPAVAVEAAGLAAAQGRPEDALKLCAWAIGRGKRDAGIEQAAALLYQQLGAYDLALPLLNDAVKKRPGEAGFRNDRGVVLRFLKRDKDARADFIKALELAPDNFPAGMNLAALYAMKGEKAEAAAVYKKLLSLPGLPPEAAAAAEHELSNLK